MTDLQYQYFTGKFEGYDKTTLFYQSWRPVFCERVIVMVHGLGEHSDRYQHVKDYFKNQGFGFYTYDHRGHGKSRGQRGYVKSFSELTSDLRAFLKLISIHENNRPIVLLGHSLGGLICLRYLVEMESKNGIVPSAVILTNPTLKVAVEVPKWKEVASGFCSKFLPRLSLYNELDLKNLSHDPKVFEAVRKDPLCHQRITARFYEEMLSSIQFVKDNVDLIHVPLCFLLGGEDRIVDPRGTQEVFNRLELPKKELKLYPSFYHELMNEIGKEEVFNEMKLWLRELSLLA